MKSALGPGALLALLVVTAGCAGDGGDDSASQGRDRTTPEDVAEAAGCTLSNDAEERFEAFEGYLCTFTVGDRIGEQILIQEWGTNPPGNFMEDPSSSPMYQVDGSSVTFMMLEDDAAQATRILEALGVGGHTVGPADEETAEETAPKEERQIVGVGQTATVRGGEEIAFVTIHKITYPPATTSDRPMSRGRVLVAIETKIVSEGQTPAYGMTLYPDWLGADGRFIQDVGHHEAPVGVYGEGEYRDQIPDEVSTGEDAQGWALYEVPKEPGTLIFSNGVSPFGVPVDPTG